MITALAYVGSVERPGVWHPPQYTAAWQRWYHLVFLLANLAQQWAQESGQRYYLGVPDLYAEMPRSLPTLHLFVPITCPLVFGFEANGDVWALT